MEDKTFCQFFPVIQNFDYTWLLSLCRSCINLCRSNTGVGWGCHAVALIVFTPFMCVTVRPSLSEPLLVHLQHFFFILSRVKIAVGYRIFPTELIKLPISYIDKFSKKSDSKKKIKSLRYPYDIVS